MATLASVTDLSTYLQRTLSIEEEIAATFALEVATSLIQGYTGQHFFQVVNDVITVYPRAGVVLLPQLPVASVASVTTKDGAVVSHTLRNDGILHLESTWTDFVTITYTHGYATADIPAAVRGAALRIASDVISKPSGSDVRQESVGSYSVTYATSSESGSGLSGVDRQLLAPYRLTRMV